VLVARTGLHQVNVRDALRDGPVAILRLMQDGSCIECRNPTGSVGILVVNIHLVQPGRADHRQGRASYFGP